VTRGGEEPRALRDAIGAVTRELGLPAPGVVARLAAVWPDIVGPALAARCAPGAVRAGVCSILVDEAAWASPVRYLERQVVERSAEVLGPGVVTGVKVVVRRREQPGS
jgi:predicted nucleic acid-binding Zn ribbon protein